MKKTLSGQVMLQCYLLFVRSQFFFGGGILSFLYYAYFRGVNIFLILFSEM